MLPAHFLSGEYEQHYIGPSVDAVRAQIMAGKPLTANPTAPSPIFRALSMANSRVVQRTPGDMGE
jgi:hypothetical protein